MLGLWQLLEAAFGQMAQRGELRSMRSGPQASTDSPAYGVLEVSESSGSRYAAFPRSAASYRSISSVLNRLAISWITDPRAALGLPIACNVSKGVCKGVCLTCDCPGRQVPHTLQPQPGCGVYGGQTRQAKGGGNHLRLRQVEDADDRSTGAGRFAR